MFKGALVLPERGRAGTQKARSPIRSLSLKEGRGRSRGGLMVARAEAVRAHAGFGFRAALRLQVGLEFDPGAPGVPHPAAGDANRQDAFELVHPVFPRVPRAPKAVKTVGDEADVGEETRHPFPKNPMGLIVRTG